MDVPLRFARQLLTALMTFAYLHANAGVPVILYLTQLISEHEKTGSRSEMSGVGLQVAAAYEAHTILR